jgi:hypothetical protein
MAKKQTPNVIQTIVLRINANVNNWVKAVATVSARASFRTTRRKGGIAVESRRLVVEPLQRHRYTLDELLTQCDPKTPRSKQEREWLGSRPAGGELL